jgi:hypothetical protein
MTIPERLFPVGFTDSIAKINVNKQPPDFIIMNNSDKCERFLGRFIPACRVFQKN